MYPSGGDFTSIESALTTLNKHSTDLCDILTPWVTAPGLRNTTLAIEEVSDVLQGTNSQRPVKRSRINRTLYGYSRDERVSYELG